ncbi:MAG TPA: hypothetical protein VJN18_24395 [Polyangiaceae bacterium]|nr:hypothetical protein [Polyangiaceae bacterium]
MIRLLGSLTAARGIAVTCGACCLVAACDFFTFSAPTLDPDAAGAGGAEATPGLGDGGAAGSGESLEPPEACHPTNNPCMPADTRVCFQGSALGGEDFCVERCDPIEPSDDELHRCVDSGALLRRCHPNGAGPAADCPPGYNCYRTNLTEDQGVCIDMPVCSENADCLSTAHGTCASTLVSNIAGAQLPPELTGLYLDHLNCIHIDCVANASNCSSNEGCLGEMYSPDVADLCTPSCDVDDNCPPNYSCGIKTSGEGAPNLCFPGVPGNRCVGQSCVVGSCMDTGAGFSVCTIPCETNLDCAVLNSPHHQFLCVEGGGTRHCVTPAPFNGAFCTEHWQCRADRNETCSFIDALGFDPGDGECRAPCNANGTCDPQGGLPHVCLENGEGGCFPGRLGMECKLDSECIVGKCQLAPGDPHLGHPPGGMEEVPVCTLECDSDDEVAGDKQCDTPQDLITDGFCLHGYCRLKVGVDDWCTRDAQCNTGLCNTQDGVCEPKNR